MEDNNFSSNRRNLLKAGLLVAGGSALGLTGCAKKENAKEATTEEPLLLEEPKVYNFSAPLLFYTDYIDSLVKYNEKCKKSKITSLYNSLPWPLSQKYNEWFMLSRGGQNPNIKSYADFDKYVKYAMDKGFEVVYLMNSPRPFEERDINPLLGDFHKLLDQLWKSGIRRIKFANTEVAQVIYEHNPDFKFHVATILEYSSLRQYQDLVKLFPNITHICIPKDQNQNFKFIKSLKKAFPDIELEVMVDEGCSKGCPTRLMCMSLSPNRFKLGCFMDRGRKPFNRIFNGEVHPWDIAYYQAAGVDSYKFVPEAFRCSDKDCWNVKMFMNIIEHDFDDEHMIKYIRKNYSLIKKDVKVKEFIAAFPDIKHFIAHGHECDSQCGVDCKYCHKYVEKIAKYIKPTAYS